MQETALDQRAGHGLTPARGGLDVAGSAPRGNRTRRELARRIRHLASGRLLGGRALHGPRQQVADDGSDRVFLGPDGSPLKVGSLGGLWEEAIETAGDEIAASKRDSLTFHCLRHMAANLMATAGIPMLDIADVLRHSTISVTMHCAHVAPESGRKAMAVLGDALARRGKNEAVAAR